MAAAMMAVSWPQPGAVDDDAAAVHLAHRADGGVVGAGDGIDADVMAAPFVHQIDREGTGGVERAVIVFPPVRRAVNSLVLSEPSTEAL